MQNNHSRENANSIFRNPADEESLCAILKTYVEEWGPEYVIVSVPKHWKDYGSNSLGRVRLEFSEYNRVCIRVRYPDAQSGVDINLDYAIELNHI